MSHPFSDILTTYMATDNLEAVDETKVSSGRGSPPSSVSSSFTSFFQGFSCCVSSRKNGYPPYEDRLTGTGARSRPRRKIKHPLPVSSASSVKFEGDTLPGGVHSLPVSSASSVSIKSNPLLENWMEHFSDFRWVDIPIIPGTHHSGVNNPRKRTSQPVWGWAKCQDIGIDEQLHFGVRFLDLRVRVMPATGEVLISHGLTSDTSLLEALEVVSAYLQAHSTESILLYVRADKWHGIDKESSDLLANTIRSSSIKFHDFGISDMSSAMKDLYVKDTAGKCLLIVGDQENLDSNSIAHLVGKNILKYCDIWQSTSIEDAKAKIEQYMQIIPNCKVDEFGGVAIDGTFPIRQQSQTSRELNQWFIEQLTSNETWKTRIEKHQFGIVLIDFADFDTLNFFIGLNYRLLSIRHST